MSDAKRAKDRQSAQGVESVICVEQQGARDKQREAAAAGDMCKREGTHTHTHTHTQTHTHRDTETQTQTCLLHTSLSPRDRTISCIASFA